MEREVITAEDIAARAKIKQVKDQILAAREAPKIGGLIVIHCPYCEINTPEGAEFCCELMRGCVITILMGLRQEKIEERVHVN
jgi:hypothetical protein